LLEGEKVSSLWKLKESIHGLRSRFCERTQEIGDPGMRMAKILADNGPGHLNIEEEP